MKKEEKKVPVVPETKSEALPKDPQGDVSARMIQLFGEEALKAKKLPQMRAENPYKLTSEKGEILILNSPLIGSLTSEDNEEDIVRNNLRLARVAGYDAIVLTGNLMYMLTQRYGSERPYKTQVSGVRVNVKKVQKSYPEAVVSDEKFESVEKRLEKGEPVFMTLRSRLERNTEMVSEVFTDKNGKPLFNGPVYITFGKLEDELIMFYANELLRVGLFKSRAWAQKRVFEHTSEWRKEKDPTKKKALYQKLRDFKDWLNIFAVMGNIADESIDKAREIVTGYLIKKYEDGIPNAKVLSVGDAHLKVGSRSIMATTLKSAGVNISNQTAKLAARTESYSKGRKTTNIPEVMLGTGMNPYFDMKLVTYQASDEPGDKRSCLIIQLPMCIDSERYRDVIRNQNILKDIITRVGQSSGFESGSVALRWDDCLSLPIVSVWTSDVLKNKQIFKDDDSIRNLVLAKKKEHKMIYGHKEGCSHYGASDIVLHDSPDDPNGNVKQYHQQVTKKFLLDCDAPILTHQHDGDITQGMNHDYQLNVHLDNLSPENLIKKMHELDTSKMTEHEKVKALMRLALEQKVRDGVFDFTDQVEGYAESMVPYLEYFVRILKRSKGVNLSFEGLFSVITHIAGNHNKNTFKGLRIYVSDARYITHCLREAMLAYLIDLKIPYLERIQLKNAVRKEITAPQFGTLGEGRGALKIDGLSCYSMILKHKQGAMDKTQKRASRRGMDHYEIGLPICNLSGDDHKGGVRVTRGAVHIKTGCQQGEGPFGREIDFSEQNVFSMVYGMPVGGFANGPLVFMALDYQTMRRYAMKPFPINREKLFKNALE
ncbi:MAG: hypothetical protein Q7S32_01605 [bacterium]|nr:hypothetical protein [bacterium]